MLDIFEDTIPFTAIARRIAAYVEHHDSGDWNEDEPDDYPKLIFVCNSPRLERRLQRYLAKKM